MSWVWRKEVGRRENKSGVVAGKHQKEWHLQRAKVEDIVVSVGREMCVQLVMVCLCRVVRLV
jgi:hypothetical protein